jgi:uncharacterized protein YrrD
MITAKQLYKTGIDAKDGSIGSIHDLYFDGHSWTLRYLVVDTGNWLPGRKVLIVPEVILSPWHGDGEVAVPVTLTKDQVKSSPDIDNAQPISRHAEQILHSHYGWIPYWEAPGLPVAPPPLPEPPVSVDERQEALREAESSGERHLHSTKEVKGYRVRETDGEVGYIKDFLFDDECRRILFLSVDLEQWLGSKEVLIPTRLVSKIDWASSRIEVELSCQAIKSGQQYEPAA